MGHLLYNGQTLRTAKEGRTAKKGSNFWNEEIVQKLHRECKFLRTSVRSIGYSCKRTNLLLLDGVSDGCFRIFQRTIWKTERATSPKIDHLWQDGDYNGFSFLFLPLSINKWRHWKRIMTSGGRSRCCSSQKIVKIYLKIKFSSVFHTKMTQTRL